MAPDLPHGRAHCVCPDTRVSLRLKSSTGAFARRLRPEVGLLCIQARIREYLVVENYKHVSILRHFGLNITDICNLLTRSEPLEISAGANGDAIFGARLADNKLGNYHRIFSPLPTARLNEYLSAGHMIIEPSYAKQLRLFNGACLYRKIHFYGVHNYGRTIDFFPSPFDIWSANVDHAELIDNWGGGTLIGGADVEDEQTHYLVTRESNYLIVTENAIDPIAQFDTFEALVRSEIELMDQDANFLELVSNPMFMERQRT